MLSAGNAFHPPWDVEPKDVGASASYPFFDLSWRIDRQDNRYVALADKDFPQRHEVRNHRAYRLDASDMLPVYAKTARW